MSSLNCDKLTNGSGLTLVPPGEEVEDGSQSLSAYAVPKQGGKVLTDCTPADHSDSAELAAKHGQGETVLCNASQSSSLPLRE